jgi:hypothetical protein
VAAVVPEVNAEKKKREGISPVRFAFRSMSEELCRMPTPGGTWAGFVLLMSSPPPPPPPPKTLHRHADRYLIHRAVDHITDEARSLVEIDQRYVVRCFAFVGRMPGAVVVYEGIYFALAAELRPGVVGGQTVRTGALRGKLKNLPQALQRVPLTCAHATLPRRALLPIPRETA